MIFDVTAQTEDGREGELLPVDASSAEEAVRLYRQRHHAPYPVVAATPRGSA